MRAACATVCARLFFLLLVLFGAASASAPRPKENTEKKREIRGKNRALLVGAAYTWERSSAVINIEQSEEEIKPSGVNKSSD